MPVFDDLKAKLEELFMFDRADLDFGMYRILNAKRAEVTRFLSDDLLPSARAALGTVTAEEQARLKTAVSTAREQARKFGAPDPDATSGVQEAQAAFGASTNTAALEEEIYSHLLTFFSRYYHEGDFIPQRRYSAAGRERYMIPYDGEEVKLVWANMEQYYIKSSESLTDYAFTFADPAGGTRTHRVEFKLLAATEETANNKSQTGERRFALADLAAHPPAVSADGSTLSLGFTYVEHAKGTKQADLLEAAESAALSALKLYLSSSPVFGSALGVADPTYTGKGTRTVLRKHLDVYAAKNTYDYFIHKDLGGFLRRELDYFIKTEVLRLDDLLPEDPTAARRQLQKIHALKKLASQIIAFLEQIENFQKKLWLKKKFVTEVRYCLTLDRVPEAFYAEIAANAAQREEWKALYHIQAIPADTTGQPGYPGDKQPLTVEFLKANPFLMVDTGHFSVEFTARIVAAIPKLNDSLGGVCFHSENFQALTFMQERFTNEIKAIYTDPPYNIGGDGFSYKDGFRHSTWYSMMHDSVSLTRKLMHSSALFSISIDDAEVSGLMRILAEQFGEANLAACAPWQSEPSGGKEKTGLRTGHEYLGIFFKTSSDEISKDERSTGELVLNDNKGPYRKGRELRKWGGTSLREDRPGQFYALKTLNGEESWPIKNDGREGHWRWGHNNPKIKEALLNPDFFHWEKSPFDLGVSWSGSTERWTPYEKIRDEKKSVGWSTWLDEFGINADATRTLKDLFGSKTFDTPKPMQLVEWFLDLHSDDEAYCLDSFAGSGVLGHAVLNSLRLGSSRKYVLIEMGDCFETVIVPRLKKAAYSESWASGKPTRRDTGLSHAFKIVKLESYEDTLNNLRLPARSTEQTLALDTASPAARADYLLRYSLELETKGSPSLLDLKQFVAPWSYQLAIHRHGETRPVTVNLVETFNWLLGLRVEQQDAPVTLSAEFEADASARLTVKKGTLRKADTGWTLQAVTGRDRAGRLHLIIWRSLTGDAPKDNAVLDAFFQKQGYNARDTEFDTIYVNGDNNLANLAQVADTPDAPSLYKVKLIETEFHRLMWDVRDV